MSYALSATVEKPFAQTLEATRAALADQGFGVLSEIDLAAILRAKLDADVAADARERLTVAVDSLAA